MKRRKFIKHVAHSLAIPGILGSTGFSFAGQAEFLNLLNYAKSANKKLILIYLDGGNDGLNTIIPLSQMSALNKVRPHVILPENKILALNNSSLGLHPSLEGLKSLYDEKRLSIIQSVGYPKQNFSHFRSSDIWLSGSDSDQLLNSGWAGRMIAEANPDFPEAYPNDENPHPLAVEIGFGSSLLFQGPTAAMSMVLNNSNFFYQLLNNEVQEVPDSRAGDKLKYIRLIAQQSQAYGIALKEAAGKVTSQKNYPDNNELAQQLKVIARLIKGGIQTPIYLVRLGGFDTHDAQVLASDHTLGEHASLLSTLNDAIMAFMNDIDYLGIGDDIVGMTFSEFGRRIVSNASLGTDHGAAAPVIVFGNKVRGDIFGDNPIIPSSANYSDNLMMQYDYRQVYSSLMQQWLGKDSSTANQVLFKDFETLPIIGDSVLSTNKITENVELKLYPNPVESNLNIEFMHSGGLFSIEVYDLVGKKQAAVHRSIEPKGIQKLHWDASQLSSGRYTLIYRKENEVSNINFIKL